MGRCKPRVRRADGGRARTDIGAAAVEFALVAPVLLTMVLGIMQYGLYFNDSLQVRQGVRQAARLGIVKGDASPGSCSQSDYATQLACYAVGQISPVSGDTAAKVIAPSGWAQGNPLVICAVVNSAANNIGLVPVPSSGMVRSKVRMSIEQGTAPTTFTSGNTYFTNSSGALSSETWSWCS